MTANTAPETHTPEDQDDTVGFGISIPQHPQQAFLIVVCTPVGLLPAAPQLLTCRKAGKDQQDF